MGIPPLHRYAFVSLLLLFINVAVYHRLTWNEDGALVLEYTFFALSLCYKSESLGAVPTGPVKRDLRLVAQ